MSLPSRVRPGRRLLAIALAAGALLAPRPAGTGPAAPADPQDETASPAPLPPAGKQASQPGPQAEPTEPQTAPETPPAAPGPAEGEAPALRVGAARIEQTGPHRYLFSGDVDIRYGDMRLQADEVEYDDSTHQCRAHGNVVLEEAGVRLSGERLELNLETRLATVYEAHGEMEPDLILEAERLEKIGEDRYRIVDATVTSCTQPAPYWSFRVGKGTVQIDQYAHLRNLLFRVGRVPVFYTPYLLWPVKEDRASGLLMPQVGYSQRRGAVVNTAWFWAPARNFDSTLFLDYLERDGVGAGLETRWLPNQDGRLRFTGYRIDERIEDPNSQEREGERYRFRLESDQKLPGGWRLLADLNQVSDFDYYLDFERDLRAATNRSNTSTLELTRSWSYYTFNLRGERRQQLLSEDPVTGEDNILEQRRRPEIELRGRSRRLGNSPIYFSFEASAAALERAEPLKPEVSYGRLDVFPKFRAPFRPAPWIEITPAVSYRETIYTHQRDLSGAGPAIDETLRRGLLRGDLDLIGPRFSRVYDTPEWGFTPRVKSVIEPRLTWTYIPDEKDVEPGAPRVLIFDEVDSQRDDLHQLTYSLTWRWFALRPASSRGETLALPRRVPLPGLAPEPQSPAEAAALARPAPAPSAPARNPIEFLTFSVSQSYGANAPLSVMRDTLGAVVDTSDFSPVTASLRLNPTAHHSVNLNATYNILRRTVERTTLSADLRSGDHILSLTWFLANNPADLADDQSQLRLFAGTALFRRKLTLALETKVDLAASDIQDQRYRIGYNTQCCGFLVEYLDRDFSLSQEREYRFLVNLKGVGTLFDLQQGVR